MFQLFQCRCTIPYSETDRTLHVLSHHRGRDKQHTPDEFRGYFQTFTQHHKDWIAAVGGKMFKRKGITVNEYITALLQPNFVLDQIGIFIFARMYHIHIALIFNDRFLCTNKDNNLGKCEIFLGYFGKMRFMDTRPIKWHPETLESLSESDDSFEVPPPAKRTPIKPRAPKPKPNKNPRAPVKPTARQLALQQKKQAEENLNSSKQNDDSDTEKENASDKAEHSENPDSSEEEPTDNKTSSAGSSKNFATKDPGAKFGRSRNPSSSNIITTNKGNILVKRPKRRPVARKFSCPWCSEFFKQLQLLQAHVKENHKDVKYTCRFCEKSFQTYGGKRKHEVLHLPPRHFCEYCEKGFHFNNELIEHHRYHTKEGLVECEICHKKFVSKRYLKEHNKKHEDEGKRYKCELCPRSCANQQNLRQHVRGAHEGSYTTLCGKKIDWPPKYHRHLRNCRDCEKVRIEERHKKYEVMAKVKHYFLHSV